MRSQHRRLALKADADDLRLDTSKTDCNCQEGCWERGSQFSFTPRLQPGSMTATANRVEEPFQRFFLGSQATMLTRLLLMNFIGKVLAGIWIRSETNKTVHLFLP